MSRTVVPSRSQLGRGGCPRRRVALALTTALGMIASACSDPPSSDAERPSRGDGADLPDCDLDAFEEAAADGPIEVELWYGGLVGEANETMIRLADDFNASQDQVALQIQDQGQDYRQAFRRWEQASGADQLPEMAYLEAEDFGSVVNSGRALPAQACMEAAGYDLTNIESLARNYFSFDGVLYAGYMNTSTPILYYNRNHWLEAGLDPDEPPTTLEEVADQAEAIKTAFAGSEKADRPFALMLDKWFIGSLFTSAGVDIVNNNNGRNGDPTEAVFDTEEARDLVASLKRMEEEGLLIAFPRDEDQGAVQHFVAAANQQASMLLGTSAGAATVSSFLGGDTSAEDIAGGETDVDTSGVDLDTIDAATAQIPGVDGPGQMYTGGGGFYIMNTSDPVQQAASWKFMEFLLQPENAMEWTTSTGYVPAVKAVMDEPDMASFLEEDPIGQLVDPAIEQLQAMDPDRPGPFIGPYIDLTDELEKALQAIFLEDADIADALSTAEANVTASLQDYYSE